MSKPRRLKGKAAKPKHDQKHRGPCFVKGCEQNGGLMHHCKVCEALIAQGEKKGEPFTVQFCGDHIVEAAARMKKHVLLKHPATIPAWMLAALTGEL
jgi:hypothetical protein